jgi:hypothetical protein
MSPAKPALPASPPPSTPPAVRLLSVKSGQRRGGSNWRRKSKTRARQLEQRVKQAASAPVRVRYVDPRTLRRGEPVQLDTRPEQRPS